MNSNAQRCAELESEIAEWSKLKGYTQHVSVLRGIEDKILSLERLVENLAPSKAKPSLTESREAAERSVTPQSNGTEQSKPELFAPISNFAWDQTNDEVKLYITIGQVKELPPEAVNVEFSVESLLVTVTPKVPGCPNQRLCIKRLFKAISPQSSKYRVRRNVISLTLHKADHAWWEDVKYKEPPKLPKFNDAADSASDPRTSLINLMKNLYDEGDDDMKRTIAKAWTESQTKQNFSPDAFGSLM